MISITDKSKCCGCSACISVCPVNCIEMIYDSEGFPYPIADSKKCIECGRCENTCPVLNPDEAKNPLYVYAAKVEEYLKHSSSGGLFPAIAKQIIDQKGIVYGAVMKSDMTVCHTGAEDMESVQEMRGSKYVQSEIALTFAEVEDQLKRGNVVFYTGTPCQIAGLKKFLRKNYDNLLTADCACHGVPSPGLWKKYIRSLENNYKGKIADVRFRDKSRSWVHYDFLYKAGDKTIRKPFMNDPYMALFIQNLTLRPSCYMCPVRNGRSGSDLTFADLWNVKIACPEYDDDRGTSLVLVNTKKGFKALSGIETVPIDKEQATMNNGGFNESVKIPVNREEFFIGYDSYNDLYKYMSSFVIRKPLHIVVYKALRNLISRIKRIIR